MTTEFPQAEGSRTPPFLIWALEVPCRLRTDIADWTAPERTERHLRAAREFGRGRREQRIVGDVCFSREASRNSPASLANVKGFLVSEILAVYGGEENLAAACANCPANTAEYQTQAPRQPLATLAGCFGILQLSSEMAGSKDWHLPWIASPLVGENAAAFLAFLTSIPWPDETETTRELPRLIDALSVSAAQQLPLHGQLYPAGRIENRRWILPATCNRCHGEWQAGTHCHLCDATGTRKSGVKRHLRGERPYLPVHRFLSSARAGELLALLPIAEN